jgi:hypothetical protein
MAVGVRSSSSMWSSLRSISSRRRQHEMVVGRHVRTMSKHPKEKLHRRGGWFLPSCDRPGPHSAWLLAIFRRKLCVAIPKVAAAPAKPSTKARSMALSRSEPPRSLSISATRRSNALAALVRFAGAAVTLQHLNTQLALGRPIDLSQDAQAVSAVASRLGLQRRRATCSYGNPADLVSITSDILERL